MFEAGAGRGPQHHEAIPTAEEHLSSHIERKEAGWAKGAVYRMSSKS